MNKYRYIYIAAGVALLFLSMLFENSNQPQSLFHQLEIENQVDETSMEYFNTLKNRQVEQKKFIKKVNFREARAF